MSAYRNDLEAAQQRAAQLEGDLKVLEAELQDARVDQREALQETRRSSAPIVISLVALILGIGVAVYVLVMPRAATPIEPETNVELVAPEDPEEVIAPPPPPSSQPNPVEPPSEFARPITDLRPSDCDPRKAYRSQAGLPLGATVAAFDVCTGCDCCLPGGGFPPKFTKDPAHPKPIPETGACYECAGAAALREAGFVVSGVSSVAGRVDPDGLEMAISLEPPTRVFAATSRPSGLQTFPAGQRMQTITLIAKDDRGRVVDGVEASYDLSMKDGADFFDALKRRERFLDVQSCNADSVIAHVAMTTDDLNVSLSGLTRVDE